MESQSRCVAETPCAFATAYNTLPHHTVLRLVSDVFYPGNSSHQEASKLCLETLAGETSVSVVVAKFSYLEDSEIFARILSSYPLELSTK